MRLLGKDGILYVLLAIGVYFLAPIIGVICIIYDTIRGNK
jgi:hypothetical protein